MTEEDLWLQAFVESADADAFRRIVDRYTPLVWSSARRQVHDAHLAEDVTQAVFILLARKAKSVRQGTLAGWLVNAARLAAREAHRGETRRKARERRVAINAGDHVREGPMPTDTNTIENFIDAALGRLVDVDRAAITLRYLQGKSQREVADAIGVSEDAAAQRLSRALGKLRKFFSRHDAILPSASISEALHRLHLSTAPPLDLARAAAAAALHPAHVSSSAAMIAQSVVVSMRWRATANLAAMLIVAVVVVVGAATAYQSRGALASAIGIDNRPRLQVGVFISATTGIGQPVEENPWYQQFRIMEELTDVRDMDLVPLIEPGSAEQPAQKRLMGIYFPGKSPVNVTDPAVLKRFDVIVASQAHYVPPAVLESIESAVKDGTGLVVRQCLGGCKPGFTNATSLRLRGYTHAVPGFTTGPVDCTIVGSHPLLGSLSGKIGTTISMYPAGGFGALTPGDSMPLIMVKSADKLVMAFDPKALPDSALSQANVLYTTSLGRGRIVACNFGGATPPALQEATGARFTSAAIRWVAHREVK